MTSGAMSLDYSIGGEHPSLVHLSSPHPPPPFFLRFLLVSSNLDASFLLCPSSEGSSQVEEQVQRSCQGHFELCKDH